jgi:hypothetical protein
VDDEALGDDLEERLDDEDHSKGDVGLVEELVKVPVRVAVAVVIQGE